MNVALQNGLLVGAALIMLAVLVGRVVSKKLAAGKLKPSNNEGEIDEETLLANRQKAFKKKLALRCGVLLFSLTALAFYACGVGRVGALVLLCFAAVCQCGAWRLGARVRWPRNRETV